MPRTRIKICGLTRETDLMAAITAGADAIGFVFYPPSPRYLTPSRAAELAAHVPAFVSRVGLFVNADTDAMDAILKAVPLELLQFHGDETGEYCRQMGARYGRPWIKAARMKPDLDLLEYARTFHGASALLLDAFVDGYGGGGETFDWSLIPPLASLPLPVILSGGLHPGNVGEAVRSVSPWAVDVSSGVETAKGIKDHHKIAEFIAGVRHADAGQSL